ncbi:SMP-30/gluconolactonase/LRE family protein [Sinomicrobium kalidii]|uniref:SMP-30/gluconolactonase/LRE family protein n=1 Tax=Sinomicrobium kalidii TaxID=2900738 RepID=UPI001E427DF7|nr:SMP-30/gluconolactonase/LRE family protein [Sinomicrobium kalidii]UGU17168.1 SMP-30/gluconolactonase/LRE family protein [Sinomicrobium kalidii]
MAEDIRYFPVNWIDGMKINKNHFIDLQNNAEDLVRDARNMGVNQLQYGLLSTKFMAPFEYSVIIDEHNELNVSIKFMKAVTPGGGRIEITDYTGEFSEKISLENYDFKENNRFLLLNVDPYNRVPTGTQNMEEIPPRFPFAMPKYYLTTVAETEVTQNNIGPLQFPIAKFMSQGSVFETVETYIPPCVTVNSHPSLVKLFEAYDAFFKQMEFYAVQISQKIRFRRLSGDENLIADIVFATLERILGYVGQTINQNRWKGFYSSPMEVLDRVVSLARVMKNSFDSFSGDGKEMVFNYFAEWTTELGSGDYEKLFSETINLKYKGYDMGPCVKGVMEFIEKTDHLFSILNQLDYIGRKKDSGIFVNENIVKTDKTSGIFFKQEENKDRDKGNNQDGATSFLAD